MSIPERDYLPTHDAPRTGKWQQHCQVSPEKMATYKPPILRRSVAHS